MFLEKLFCLTQYVIPQHWLSRALGCLAESRIRWIKNPLIEVFIKVFGVNMAEAERKTPEEFEHFNDFFTRELTAGARQMALDEQGIISPADGVVSEAGPIQNGSVLQAKGQYYSLISLVGGDAERCNQYMDGSFMTIYLSPKDYHRVHMPVDGVLKKMTYVPGKLFSVNQATANNVPGLFARNERLICDFDTPNGPMCMILVGAMVVAAIETVWAGQVAPIQRKMHSVDYACPPETISLKQGDEMGRFKLGSTVILLFPQDMANMTKHSGDALQMGQSIGQLNE
ncbi:MAG: archaetidylserine decarboxylase [Cellvibrionales bacterium]|nr:archaetidylserine decarboxylase [Cellvibrionales bacterium]